jgi:hypothetical protein
MAENTPSILDENPGTSTAIHTGPKTGLMVNTFLPTKKLCNVQTQQKESLREIQRGYHLS